MRTPTWMLDAALTTVHFLFRWRTLGFILAAIALPWLGSCLIVGMTDFFNTGGWGLFGK